MMNLVQCRCIGVKGFMFCVQTENLNRHKLAGWFRWNESTQHQMQTLRVWQLGSKCFMDPKLCCAFLSILLSASTHHPAFICRKCPRFQPWVAAFPHVQPTINKQHFLLLGGCYMQHISWLPAMSVHYSAFRRCRNRHRQTQNEKSSRRTENLE